jgi:hypothetical protein
MKGFLPQNGLFVGKTSKSASNPGLSALEPTVSVNGRTSGVNGRTSGVNGQTSGVNGRTSGVNGRTSGVNGRTSGVNGRTSGVNGRTSGINGRTSGINGRTSGVNGRTSGVNGRTSGIETRGFARGIERKAQIKPEVFTVPTLKKWGAQPPRLRFDASRVERFITQPINRGRRANCSSRAHRKVNDEASLTAREARALPQNFNVPILKNDHQSVTLTSDNLAVGALVPWW